jgi:hypothetical protein
VSTSHAKLQRRDDVWILTDGLDQRDVRGGERLSGEVALGGHHRQVRRGGRAVPSRWTRARRCGARRGPRWCPR